MTLELKRYNEPPYLLGGIREITDATEYGEGHFVITIFDQKVFFTDAFEYVKDPDTNTVYVQDGEWVAT